MKRTKFCFILLFLGAFMLTFAGPVAAGVGSFWGGFDLGGEFLLGPSDGLGDPDDPFAPDPPFFGPWWEYPDFGWWNIWWYNHEFDYCRRKTVELYVWVIPFDNFLPGWIDVTINWSTDEWSLNPPELVDPTLQPPVPGILPPPFNPTPYNPEDYIERLWTSEPPLQWHHDFEPVPDPSMIIPYLIQWEGEIPVPYNPEWVSIDIRGMNVWILNSAFFPPVLYPIIDPEISLLDSYLVHDCVECEDLEDPVAEAGPDQCVAVGVDVVLDGTASTDDCGITTWDWVLDDGSGSPVLASGPSPVVSGLTAGTYDVTLTITDCAGKTATDTMTLCMDGQDPVADAGDDQNGFTFAGVTLDGTESTDDCEIVEWKWDLDNNVDPVTTVYGETADPMPLVKGEYDVTLTVTDCAGKTGTNTSQLNIICFISTAASGSAMGLPAILTLLFGTGIIGIRGIWKSYKE